MNLVVALTLAFLLSNISILLLIGQGTELKQTISNLFETFAQSMQDMQFDTQSNFYKSEQQVPVTPGLQQQRACGQRAPPGVAGYSMVSQDPAFPTPLNAVNDGMYASNDWFAEAQSKKKEPRGIPASGMAASKNSFNFHVY